MKRYFKIRWFTSVDLWIRAGIRLIFAFRAIFIAVTFPGCWYASARSTTKMVIRTGTLSAIFWFIGAKRKENLRAILPLSRKCVSILPIRTIKVAVTDPYGWDTLAVTVTLMLV